MPNMVSVLRLNKLPVLGLVPETSGTAPTSPVNGQLWTDSSVTPKLVKTWDGSAWVPLNIYPGTGATNYAAGNDSRIVGAEQTANKGAANGYASLDGATKVPIAQLPTGTTATTVTIGNDARLSDQRTPLDNSVTSAKIVDGTIVDGDIAAANKDGVAGTPSLRTLGTGATQAAAGNDARLSDTRTPTAGSVTDSSVAAGAAIQESKLALASDAAAGTASRRTLGYTGNAAMPGTARLDQIAAPTAPVSFGNQRLSGVAPSVSGTDAVNRNELDAARQGYAGAKEPVRVATTSNVNLTTPGANIDGVAMANGDRFLAAGQTTALQNGIYVFNGSAAAATRATDADAALEVEDGTTVAVAEGTFQGGVYIQTASVGNNAPGVNVAQAWVLYSTQATYTGTANRITVTGTVIDIAGTYAGQTSITTVGTIGTGVWNGTTIAVANGGTGATTAAAARTNLGAAQAGYQGLLPALTAGAAATVTHNLNSDKVIAQVRDATTGEYVQLDIVDAPGTLNTLTVTAGIAFAANALDIVVIPI